MTPKQCFKKAKKMGYKYAGLQFGFECWAGHDAPQRMKVPNSQCSQKCNYDKSMTCGNADRNSVYALTSEAKDIALKSEEFACGKDEAINTLGKNKCSKHSECNGKRTCSAYGWCNGKSGCGPAKPLEDENKCGKDESQNILGENKCSKHSECDGKRICSEFGWCNG